MSSEYNCTCSISVISDWDRRNVEAALGGKVCFPSVIERRNGTHEEIRVIHTFAFSSIT